MAKAIDDAELIKGAFIISRSVAELMATLNMVQREFASASDAAQRRELTAWYLAVLTEFIDEQSPYGMDTAMPIHQMIGALIAADKGDDHPLTRPEPRQGGSPSALLTGVYSRSMWWPLSTS